VFSCHDHSYKITFRRNRVCGNFLYTFQVHPPQEHSFLLPILGTWNLGSLELNMESENCSAGSNNMPPCKLLSGPRLKRFASSSRTSHENGTAQNAQVISISITRLGIFNPQEQQAPSKIIRRQRSSTSPPQLHVPIPLSQPKSDKLTH
jgi:hypothetical protein